MGLYRGDAEDAFRDFADPNLKPGLVRYFWGYPDENVAYILPLGGGSSAGSPFLNGDRALEEAEFLLKTEWDFLNGAAGRHYSGMDIHTRDNRRILIVFDGAAVTMAMSPDSSDPLDYWLKDAGDESQRLERFFRSYFDLWKQLSLYGTPAPSWI
ncbi:hypothetical protein KQI84_14960 [bacterium]|nr:hypothetical protein [bacterium]